MGTAITCSTSAGASIFRHPVPQLRHKHIKDLHLRHDVLDVRRGVPQNPWLWPHLNERCRPGSKHVPIVKQTEVHRACRHGGRSLLARGVVHLALPPGPCHRRSPWSCVVVALGKGHRDAQAFMPQELPEPSLPAVDIHCQQLKAFAEVTQKIKGTLAGKRLVLLLLLLLLFQTQIDGDAMCMSTRRYELIMQHVPDQPGSQTPGWYRHPRHLCLTQVPQKICTTKQPEDHWDSRPTGRSPKNAVKTWRKMHPDMDSIQLHTCISIASPHDHWHGHDLHHNKSAQAGSPPHFRHNQWHGMPQSAPR